MLLNNLYLLGWFTTSCYEYYQNDTLTNLTCSILSEAYSSFPPRTFQKSGFSWPSNTFVSCLKVKKDKKKKKTSGHMIWDSPVWCWYLRSFRNLCRFELRSANHKSSHLSTVSTQNIEQNKRYLLHIFQSQGKINRSNFSFLQLDFIFLYCIRLEDVYKVEIFTSAIMLSPSFLR